MTWRRTVEALIAIIAVGIVRSTMEETWERRSERKRKRERERERKERKRDRERGEREREREREIEKGRDR